MSSASVGTRSSVTWFGQFVPPQPPPNYRWVSLMSPGLITFSQPNTDPCIPRDWERVVKWNKYPGAVGGIVKNGDPSPASCRVGFTVTLDPSFRTTLQPSHLLVGFRRKGPGNVRLSVSSYSTDPSRQYNRQGPVTEGRFYANLVSRPYRLGGFTLYTNFLTGYNEPTSELWLTFLMVTTPV